MKKNFIKAIIVLTMVLLTLIPLSVSAATSGTCGDNLKWTLDDNGTLTISGNGELNTTNYINTRPWYSIRESITSIIIEDGVTSIGDYAFLDSKNLKNVTLGKNITHIGKYAFSGCNVENLYLDRLDTYLNIVFENYYSYPTTSNTIYVSNEPLKDIVIPDGVTIIPNNIFSYNNNITSLTISDCVESIGSYAFQGCNNLTDVTLGENLKDIGEGAFSFSQNITSLIVPDSVTSIGGHAFQGCDNLTKVTLGSGIKKIGEYAFESFFIKNLYLNDLNSYLNIEFEDFTGIPSDYADIYVSGNLLTDVIIPDGTTIIPARIFQWNKHITSITIPDSVTEIGDQAFEGCNTLKTVTLGKSKIKYGESVFNRNLEKLFLSDLESYMNSEFSNLYSHPSYYAEEIYLNNLPLSNVEIPYGSTKIIPGLYKNNTSIIIPDTVKEISDGAFKNCDNIIEITIPEGVTRIGYEAFKDCDKLATIIIPNTVTYIDDYAFEYCYELRNINFPNSIEYIGYRIFYNMYNVQGTWIDGGFYIGNYLIDTSSELFEEFIIKEGTICIAGGALGGSKVTSVQIPNSVVSIGALAFNCCNALKQITIPASVKTIGECAFGYCENLENITFEDGVESIEYQAFINCSSLSEVFLPDSLITLGKQSFSNCSRLSNVILSSNLNEIKEYTFQGCSNLVNITIPNSITNIKLVAFNGCNNLQNVYFLGTEKQWNTINIEHLNEPLLNATTHYIIPSTKTTIENKTFIVTPKNVPIGSIIIFVCYNDKQMVYVETFTYTGEETKTFTHDKEYDKVKVMVWESLETCVPLCEVENVPLN